MARGANAPQRTSQLTTDAPSNGEYDHLRNKRKERRGNEEATVDDVWVGEDAVVYTDEGWVPKATESFVDGRGSVGETFRTEPHLLARELAQCPCVLRRAVLSARSLSMRQAIIGVILLKELVIVALIAWLVI